MDKKHLSAKEVSLLPVGSKVTIHGETRQGYRTEQRCTIVQRGKTKMLQAKTPKGTVTRYIREVRGKWYTEGWGE